MSAAQLGPRRLSSRIQEKVDAHPSNNGEHSRGPNKKRKNDYDEDDDGFTFSRVSKSKKPRKSKGDNAMRSAVQEAVKTRKLDPAHPAQQEPELASASHHNDGTSSAIPPKQRRKKMSFSTPKAKEIQPVRRSKRLSSEAAQQNGSPSLATSPATLKPKKRRSPDVPDDIAEGAQKTRTDQHKKPRRTQVIATEEPLKPDHSATKIALPFADTPVIRRNKAMREGKSMKGDRRSSLGLRGRRASSLIDAGNSNALPHQEVAVVDFYKHIESDLIEPRRMRQLLTWCATRAMHAKPQGTDFEDASAKSAARVIEEELMKELSSKSGLSDWFGREDVQEPSKPLPQRPNPKNVQNSQKIAELEQQINRLKVERIALENLLHPPDMLRPVEFKDDQLQDCERDLLSDEDAALLGMLDSSSELVEDVSHRLNEITSNLGPSIDRFVDGVHKVAQYCGATDAVAGKVLAICADRIDQRERAGKRKALDTEDDRSPGRDLSSVLRGISKADV